MSRTHRSRRPAKAPRQRTNQRRASRRNRARGRRERLRVIQDTETVFRRAILEGVLSADPNDRRYAGHYLYLFHDENGVAWFKHRDTRQSVSMRAERVGAGDRL